MCDRKKYPTNAEYRVANNLPPLRRIFNAQLIYHHQKKRVNALKDKFILPNILFHPNFELIIHKFRFIVTSQFLRTCP